MDIDTYNDRYHNRLRHHWTADRTDANLQAEVEDAIGAERGELDGLL